MAAGENPLYDLLPKEHSPKKDYFLVERPSHPLIHTDTVLVRDLHLGQILRPNNYPGTVIRLIVQNDSRTDVHLYYYTLGHAVALMYHPDDKVDVWTEQIKETNA